MPVKVIMPQLGESVVEGTVSRWLKQVGDHIEEFESLVEVSTDKVDTEIPSPATGQLLEILVPAGTTVERGTLLALIGEGDEANMEQAVSPAPSVHTTPATIQHSPASVSTMSSAQRYSPVVARMAAEHQLDLTQINGTGLNGRITKKDIEAYLQGNSASQTATSDAELEPWERPGSGDLFKPTDEIFKANLKPSTSTTPVSATPSTPSAVTNTADKVIHVPSITARMPVPDALRQQFPAGQLAPHSRMRLLIAEHMVRSKLHTAPHVTTMFEIDMTPVWKHWQAHMEQFAAQGVKLTLTAYFMQAISRAVQAYPILNSQWTDEGLFNPNTINIGMAVALTDGLIVPVIRGAENLNLMGMARAVSDLAIRARAKQLQPTDTQNGTITLTNHGVSGSILATPIINQPQSAIVGVGAIQKRVVVIGDDDTFAVRRMMYATLTFDHRVADGAIGDGFMSVFKSTLEQWKD